MRFQKGRGGGPGQFQKGQSGNPGGRPKDDIRLRDLAREKSEAALEVLTTLMVKAKNEAVRVRAAEAVLDRAWGKPAQEVAMEHRGVIPAAAPPASVEAARELLRAAGVEA